MLWGQASEILCQLQAWFVQAWCYWVQEMGAGKRRFL